MAVDIVARSEDTKWVRVDPSSRTWHGVPIRYPFFRCLSNPSEVANCFPQASHNMQMAPHTLLGAGTFVMKYNTTKNEQEMKQQEIKKLQTIGTWENGEHHCQRDLISFIFMAQAPPHNSKFIPRKKWKKMQHNHVDVEDERVCRSQI